MSRRTANLTFAINFFYILTATETKLYGRIWSKMIFEDNIYIAGVEMVKFRYAMFYKNMNFFVQFEADPRILDKKSWEPIESVV